MSMTKKEIWNLIFEMRHCTDCASEIHFCTEHQKARIEYEQLNRGNVDRNEDQVYLELLDKYNELDCDIF